MKVVKAQEMARIEKLAYSQGASEEEFMNQAGFGVAELAQRIIAKLHAKPKIILLCGSGNNAGDAYVAGKLLHAGGFVVSALSFAPYDKSSPLCQLQSKRFVDAGGVIHYIQDPQDIKFGDAELLIDGILGTGFHGEVKGLFKEAIEKANASSIPILAIDIPSGINGSTGEVGGSAIQAYATLFLGLPKVGCFFERAWNHAGDIHVFDFGLGEKFINEAKADYLLIEDATVGHLLPKINRTRHKYQAGYVIGIGGSKGMPGAPVMTSFSALRAGAGIVRLFHPEEMEAELAFAPYEVIRQGYPSGDAKPILEAMNRASAIFVGPGIGTSSAALKILEQVLPVVNKPCVIDADALTLLSAHSIRLPPQTIMTPHHGEMKRLLKTQEELSFEQLLERSRAFSQEKNITLVLKGAPTFIFHPHTVPYICSRGDPGMATAGSGDVLTGIIAAFLAQTKDPLKAALLGVQLHAVAGEYASKKETPFCMTATDITAALPLAFKDYL